MGDIRKAEKELLREKATGDKDAIKKARRKFILELRVESKKQ